MIFYNMVNLSFIWPMDTMKRNSRKTASARHARHRPKQATLMRHKVNVSMVSDFLSFRRKVNVSRAAEPICVCVVQARVVLEMDESVSILHVLDHEGRSFSSDAERVGRHERCDNLFLGRFLQTDESTLPEPHWVAWTGQLVQNLPCESAKGGHLEELLRGHLVLLDL